MDQNQIIELINTNLPIIAASPVVVKLIESVGNVVKALYLPTLTFKKGKAEVDVEMYRKQQEQGFLENQTFTLYEITKLKNFINAANFAAEDMNGDDVFCEEPIDFDWLMRFFDAVGNISNEELQKLWGKVLAGEVKNPGNFSLRTLDIVRNMTQKEAKLFNDFCRYILISGDCYCIYSNGFSELDNTNKLSKEIITKRGYKYSTHIIPLIECGLLSIDNSLATDFQSERVLSVYNQNLVSFIMANPDDDVTMSIDAYFLTTCGIELFNVVSQSNDFSSDNEYAISCFKELKEQYPKLTITAHYFTGDDEEPYFDDLLV